MASVHDGNVDSAFTRELRGAQFGNHATTAERTLAIALRF
jgi:hypothetical protein